MDVKHFKDGEVYKDRLARNEKVIFSAAPVGTCAALVLGCGQVLKKAEAADSEFAKSLYESSMKEVELGRMSGPHELKDLDLTSINVASRFGVSQGS